MLMLVSLMSCKFQFTHPGRGATLAFWVTTYVPNEFQFTHPGRGATSKHYYPT